MTHNCEPKQTGVKTQIGPTAIPYQDISNQHVARMMLEDGIKQCQGVNFFMVVFSMTTNCGIKRARTQRTLPRGTAKRLAKNTPSRAGWRVLGRSLHLKIRGFLGRPAAEATLN